MTSEELWKMPSWKFNQWREENDLPKLFAFFSDYLPGFKDWLKAYKMSVEVLVKIRTPGQLFHGTSNKILYEKDEVDEYSEKYSVLEPQDTRAEKDLLKILHGKKIRTTVFLPYLKWGQVNCGKKEFIPTKFAGHLSTLGYTVGHAAEVPNLCSWTLLSGITVLKLGAVKVSDWNNINGRNLDFTNLDFLEIEGGNHGNTEGNIYYSHCHNIKLCKGRLDFINFVECDIRNFTLQDSTMYSSLFLDCRIWKLNCSNSYLTDIAISNSSMGGLNFNNAELQNVNYLPSNYQHHREYAQIAENYKKLRIAYSKMGNRLDTKMCYLKERVFRLKSKIYSLKFIHPFESLLRGQIWTALKKIKEFVVTLFDITTDLAAHILWGFGEKPGRLLLHSIVIILVYAACYFSLQVLPNENFVDNLYLSVFTFTRVGFVNVPDASNTQKLLLGSEAIAGWVMIGLIITGYVNKLKY